jgi:hypothetical protein
VSESTALLLAVTVGLPCALLALAVVHHARVVGRMPAAYDGWDPEEAEEPSAAFTLPSMPPASEPDPAMTELRQTMTELQAQLGRQRDALTGLLSDQRRAASSAAVSSAPLASTMPITPSLEVGDLGTAVRNLSAEGLSDRAIARRLRVGLEEVRMLSRRRELAS